MEDDIQLVQQILAGDKQVYINIINKYNNPLYATILRMTKNHQTAQDLVQEAFIKVYEQLGKYDQNINTLLQRYRELNLLLADNPLP